MDIIIGKKFKLSKRALVFFGISLCLHLGVSIIHVSQSQKLLISHSPAEETQKILLNLVNTKFKKQIVATEQSKNKDISKLKKITKLSKSDNFFERETRAVNGQKFEHAGLGKKNALDKKMQNSKKKSVTKKLENIKFSDLGLKTKDVDLKKLTKSNTQKQMVKKGVKSGSKLAQGLGSTSDHLEDIPLGDFTKLNTQEYEFYGFYNRIRMKLEQFWGFNIKDKAEKIFKQGRSLASDNNLLTGLTIKLNENGEIVDILVKSASGVKELDDAAIESFNQAGPFPNPPKGMLKDGKAIIDWSFVVNT